MLALMLLVPLSGCQEENVVSDEQYQTTEEEYIVITLDTPVVSKRNGDAGETWDVTLTIMDINPNSAMVRWIEVQVSVKGADGSVLLLGTIPSHDTGIYGTEPEIWYQEVSGAEDRATVSDGFRVTSMSRDFEGATVQVTRQGDVLASATLPGIFW